MKKLFSLFALFAVLLSSTFAQVGPPIGPAWPIYFECESTTVTGNVIGWGDSSGGGVFATSSQYIHRGEGGAGLTKTEARSGKATWTFRAGTALAAPYGGCKIKYNIIKTANGFTEAANFTSPVDGTATADSSAGGWGGSAFSQIMISPNEDSYDAGYQIIGTSTATIGFSPDGYPFVSKSGTWTISSDTVQSFVELENLVLPHPSNWYFAPYNMHLRGFAHASYTLEIVSVEFV